VLDIVVVYAFGSLGRDTYSGVEMTDRKRRNAILENSILVREGMLIGGCSLATTSIAMKCMI
jgi:hypothetical protein